MNVSINFSALLITTIGVETILNLLL